jgi:uncharacterized protein YbjT (DUF2867 family)
LVRLVHLTVIGSTGFVGRILVPRLAAAGHEVTGVSRRERAGADTADRTGQVGRVRHLAVDAGDEDAMTAALGGSDAAFYLVHSMAGIDFRTRDLELATAFGRAASRAGVGRIVYLGALGDDPASEHLLSRQEVGAALGAAGVPVVELRAAVVVGSGSISFEMLRYLTERLPFMVCPRWVHTRLQPIAARDLLTYLEGSLAVAPGVYEIGGAEVTTYREMIDTYAEVRGLRHRLIVDVPYLTPRLSSYWVDLVTPVDRHISHALIDSLVTEVVVHDGEHTAAAFGIEPMTVADAIREALDDQETALERDLLSGSGQPRDGLHDGVYSARVRADIAPGRRDAVRAELGEIGGRYDWYGVAFGWRVRVVLGRPFGERFHLHRPSVLAPGTPVDWWTVVRHTDDELVLRGQDWFAGDALLGYRVDGDTVLQVGALRTRGVPGFLYWKLLTPVHHLVFRTMARRRAKGRAKGRTKGRGNVRGKVRGFRLERSGAGAATMPSLR